MILVPIENLPLQEQIFSALFVNIGYHTFYHAFNKVPLIQLNWLPENSILKNLVKKGYVLISYFMIAISMFMSVLLVYDSINTEEYYRIITILVLVGASFGAINLNLDLKNK